MKKIMVEKSNNDSLISQLSILYKAFKNTNEKEDLLFDLSMVEWGFPLLILPIVAYVKNNKSKIVFDNSKIKSYLETIRFPKGVDSISEFEKQTQIHKSFIPISVLRKKSKIQRERLQSLFEMKIYKILGSIPGARNAIFYPMSELVTNIFEHSGKDEGYLFAQFYPSKKYLDICIVDCGIGLANGYNKARGVNLSDEQAIIEAMSGNSIKSETERGYGLRTSKDVICKALAGGEFILLSGSAVLVSLNKRENIVTLPDFYWQGVVISYRIPKPDKPVNISDFLE